MEYTKKSSVIIALSREFLRLNSPSLVNSLVRRWWQMELADLQRLLVRKQGEGYEQKS
jgi:hypothetical protein